MKTIIELEKEIEKKKAEIRRSAKGHLIKELAELKAQLSQTKAIKKMIEKIRDSKGYKDGGGYTDLYIIGFVNKIFSKIEGEEK